MNKFDELKQAISDNQLGIFKENMSFKELTTLKIGGNIRLVYYPNSIESFRYLYSIIKTNNIKYMIIGAGSNILASDNFYNGMVVNFKNIFAKYAIVGNKVIIYPQVKMSYIGYELSKKNYQGFAFMSGIPGTIAGGILMNAGCYSSEVSDNLLWVKVLDENNEVKKLEKRDIIFQYRNTSLKTSKLIILESCFVLEKTIDNQMDIVNELRKKRIDVQPLKEYNAGSTFKNHSEYKSWKLISDCGLRNLQIGDAKVSNKHANFLINVAKASSEEMIELIRMIKNEVKKQKDIDLECEWELINF